jgi:hypothetical protein
MDRKVSHALQSVWAASLPQRLKPLGFHSIDGTTEVVPFHGPEGFGTPQRKLTANS